MANHKRKRPKNRRAGCLLCKWWKSNGMKGMTLAQTLQERKARINEREGKAEASLLDLRVHQR